MSSWPLTSSGRVDLALVEELARLQLAARRLGCSIRLHEPPRQLTELLILTGLADILLPGTAPDASTLAEPGGLECRS